MLTVIGILVVAAIFCAILDKPSLGVICVAIAVALQVFPK